MPSRSASVLDPLDRSSNFSREIPPLLCRKRGVSAGRPSPSTSAAKGGAIRPMWLLSTLA